MTKRKSTIQVKKIAEKLNLSPSTVSMVLNNKARQYRISKQTCERIFQAAKELGYEPPVRAKPPKAGLKFDIPIVLYNRTAKRYSSVLTDDYAVGTGTMEHFIKRGHTRFGIVSPNYSSRALSMRVTGYRDKFKSHFPPGAAYLAPVSYGDDSDGGGYAAMRELLDGEQKPTAVFVASDNMVGGVLRCIHEAGLAVPGDIELISFGDKPIHQILRPTITSFSPPTDTMSYNCAMLLHRFIEEGILTDNVKLSFEAACVFRESCPE